MGDDVRDRRPVVPEGLGSESAGLVLRSDDQQPSDGRFGARPSMGVFWSSLGSAFAPMAPVLANVLVAFGFALVVYGGRQRERVFALVASLATGAAASIALFGVESVPMTLASVLCAYALARELAWGRLTTGGLLAVTATTTLVLMGLDMASASLQGTSVTQLMTSALDQVVEANVASLDLEGVSALLESKDKLVAYWPTLYFAVGAAMALCSLAGALLGARATADSSHAGMIVRYDVPFWVALLFAAGIVTELLGPLLPAWQDGAAMVGANVVMVTRIALAQQGLSVMLWWLREHRAAGPLRMLAVLLALQLEASLALTSVVGLVDVAVNFRHLERKGFASATGWTRDR